MSDVAATLELAEREADAVSSLRLDIWELRCERGFQIVGIEGADCIARAKRVNELGHIERRGNAAACRARRLLFQRFNGKRLAVAGPALAGGDVLFDFVGQSITGSPHVERQEDSLLDGVRERPFVDEFADVSGEG